MAAVPGYFRDLREFRAQSRRSEGELPMGRLFPCLNDRGAQSAGGHYFHQDLHVARRIYENKPDVHVDIGSRIDGFIAHVAVFRPIIVLDIRATPDTGHENIRFVQADLTALDDRFQDYCDSLSCLHANEHFGLGRYGDPIIAGGHLAGFANMSRLLRSGGKFYYAVPIGPARVEFNAHRVFSVQYLLDLFRDRYRLDSFCYVDDSGSFHRDAPLSARDVRDNFGCSYGCGVFEMTKL